ncbi:PLP-dependent aminotransferase family protein [Hwanghaeella sp.]|uniref:aminotransferase-like domain-containing protein n=1 Tax=Hwanghaeella sp. TaxID=2605943 RepID=UPI003CCBD665
MSFDYSAVLSARAAAAASPFKGYPPYHFVGGNIDEPSLPAAALADAVGKVLRAEGHDMAKYGMESGPQGYLPLREFICDNLKRRAAMTVSPDEVLITTGSLQAMDLVNEALLEPGDVVVLEGANYGGALTRLRRLGVDFVGVDLDEGGMRMDSLRAAMEELKSQGRKPKMIYTIPTVQNPTGTVMSRDRRLEMLQIARDYDVPIFEDDCYADLIWEGERPPAIHSLDTDGRVIYCATFSKTIAPALRVGYIVAPWAVLKHILPLKTDAGSGALEQMVLAEYLPSNFDNHVNGLLPILKQKAEAMTQTLDEHFGAAAEYEKPIGGIYIWVTLPKQVDTRKLFAAASAEGIAINPGPEWTVDGEANKHRMRLCFGHPSVENIREGVAKLADVCHREFGVPLTSGNVERG